MRQPAELAAQITYCLRRMGALSAAAKRGRAMLFEVTWEANLHG